MVERKMIPFRTLRVFMVAGLLLAALLSCGNRDKHLNVVVVGIDTLRPDHLTCYGYERATSPNIDEFAASGVLFENTVSQAPWTAPSFATVFSSLYPSQHGSMGVRSKVRTSVPTLATMLKEHDYATGAIINAPALKPEFGLSRGFDFYDMTPLEGRIGDGTTRDALEWIDENRNGPFFLFVHYFDPHIPYAPPPGYDNLFNPGYEGRIKNPFDLEGFSLARPKLFEELKVLSAEDWAEVINLYDGEIVYVDSAFGDLVRGIEERGLRDNTVIIMLSDHGEEFFEHGGFEHGHSLYDELIRVPLVISLPGRVNEGIRVRNQVRLLDVTPTVFDLIGLEPQPHFEGVSLVPYLTGQGSVETATRKLLPPHIAFSEAIRLGTEKKAITARPHKLIYDIVSTEEEFYNLDEDAGETHDLGTKAGSSALLRTSLFKTMLEVDETWYIEMEAGGRPHVFDIEVVSERGPMTGRIYLPRVIEPGGELTEIEQYVTSSKGENAIELRGIEIDSRLLLAFKAIPDKIPLSFDLRIDGESAVAHTYLGASLKRPDEMPFSQKASRENIKARGRPLRLPPSAPYITVWVSESTFKGDTGLTLTEETKRELRSLGYVQ